MVRRKRRKWSAASGTGKVLFPSRLRVLTLFIVALFGIVSVRLFHLQVIQGEEYDERMQSQVSTETEMSARRGDILVRDTKTEELTKLALNTSLNWLYVDAQEIPDKQFAAELLTPIIFTEEDYEYCLEEPEICPPDSVVYPEPDINTETGEVTIGDPIMPSFEEALQKRQTEVLAKLNTDGRYVFLKRRLDPRVSDKIQKLKDEFAYEHKKDRARLYAEKKDVDLAIPNYLKGVILEPRPLRYYPEGTLASQIIGFINHDGQGQYGVEGRMKRELAGEKGVFFGRTDTRGRSIGLSVEDFQKAVDGSDIVLTIDRLIQQKVETVLSAAVEKFNADSGQVIIMDPKTGFILAMANYPTFDPNQFGDVYLIRRTTPDDTDHIHKTTPLFTKERQDGEDVFLPSTFEEYEEAWRLEFDPEFYIYENYFGPGVYVNKAVQEIYEPGSVFKPLVMAIALNENEVTPFTEYFEDKPIQVDVGGRLVPIRNADQQYKGWQTMINVLERSANLGMAFVAKKLGKGVMYENLNNFQFGVPTYIELDEEQSGTLTYYMKWSTATLLNTSFGQGVSATPLQVVRAWAALANGGQLPKPHIVAEVRDSDGTVTKTEPEFEGVLKADTSQRITAMLVNAVSNGVARPAAIPGYQIAGKTGTSQIARTDGVGYEDTRQQGSTITSFAGYGPAEDPRFVMLVKFDRPRYGSADNTWGSNTAAPVFKEIAEFLLDYYDIPPKFPDDN